MSNKEKLKGWELLKTQQEYDFFYRITKMMSNTKIEEFGANFLQDLEILTDIVRNGKEQDAKIYINSLSGKERQIVAADTYYTMYRVYNN